MISQKQAEILHDQLHAMHRARMLAALDYHRGRDGPGAHLHTVLHHPHGAPWHGRGIDTPSFHLYDGHLDHLGGLLPVIGGDGLPVIGGGLPVMGAGFKDWIRKLGSLGKKAVMHVATHAKAAVMENKDRLAEIAKGAAGHVMSGPGTLGERLKGGIARAATESHALAREQAADRMRALIQ